MSENERQTQTNAVINEKLQGTVVTQLRCGGIGNNQIKKGLLLSLPVKNFLKSVNFGIITGKKVYWFLLIPPHLKYVATRPCNLFSDIKVSHGSVATYASCGGTFCCKLSIAYQSVHVPKCTTNSKEYCWKNSRYLIWTDCITRL